MTSVLEEWKKKVHDAEKSNMHFREERRKIYLSIQDFRVSANRTDEAVKQMHNIDKLINKNERTIRSLNKKIKDHEDRQLKPQFSASRDFSGIAD